MFCLLKGPYSIFPMIFYQTNACNFKGLRRELLLDTNYMKKCQFF